MPLLKKRPQLGETGTPSTEAEGIRIGQSTDAA